MSFYILSYFCLFPWMDVCTYSRGKYVSKRKYNERAWRMEGKESQFTARKKRNSESVCVSE